MQNLITTNGQILPGKYLLCVPGWTTVLWIRHLARLNRQRFWARLWITAMSRHTVAIAHMMETIRRTGFFCWAITRRLICILPVMNPGNVYQLITQLRREHGQMIIPKQWVGQGGSCFVRLFTGGAVQVMWTVTGRMAMTLSTPCIVVFALLSGWIWSLIPSDLKSKARRVRCTQSELQVITFAKELCCLQGWWYHSLSAA